MRRSLLTAMMMAGALMAQAENYAYLVIEQNDGTSLSMPAVGLNISYSDGNLVATNGTERATIQLTNVSRMYFSNEKTATAIEATAADWNDAETEIYDLSGRRLPKGTKPARGLYIFKKGNTTTKKFVR